MNDAPQEGAARDIAIFAPDETRSRAHACREARARGLLMPDFCAASFFNWRLIVGRMPLTIAYPVAIGLLLVGMALTVR